MPDIRLIDATQIDAAVALRSLRNDLLLDRLVLDDSPEWQTVRDIVADVRRRGDAAVQELTARYDGADIAPDVTAVPKDRIAEAARQLPASLQDAMQHAIDALRRFQESLVSTQPQPLEVNGKRLAVRLRPVRRVAVCVPGAAAPLFSSAIHGVVPAQVAGVREIVLVAPPRHDGDVHPTILGVAGLLGIREVYRMGGAQAIAALAFGTERVRRVDKIVGPGSVYTQLAKRALYGVVDIDMFAGPSEVVIIADDSARPEFVAADMLAQAEHDPGCAVLLTDSERLIDGVKIALDTQLATLSRREGAGRSLSRYGAIVRVRDVQQAIALTNEIAPEHLQIEAEDPSAIADRIDAAGAMFLGHFTPEAAGDYVAGPSHILPTGGTARFWSGVSVWSFLRSSSQIEYYHTGLAHDAEAIRLLAEAEGMDAHAHSVAIRTRAGRR